MTKKNYTDSYIERAKKYYAEGSFRMAASEFKRSADELCNDDAMVYLGDMYLYGVGVEENYDTALHYFKEAIRIRNNGLAMCKIGDMYLLGKGVRRDVYEAFHWFEKALDEDEPEAMWRMGQKYNLFNLKFGIDENPKKAFDWYKKAADLGNAHAMESLGDLYNSYEDDIEHDEKKAFVMYYSASRLGNINAQGKVGEMYYYGRGTDTDRDTGLILMIGAAPYSKFAQTKLYRLESDLWHKVKGGNSLARQRLKELKTAYKVFAKDGNPFAEERLDNEDFQYI